ncbi:hypothetical protein [Bacillus pumilus]|uniref:Uncharacterized protein n=1 Tax=Bacillus pumilus TaxID=1408 RepID=A0AAD0MMC1_BACPU|nr:hypothetical protein [Bacillus pumilus]AVM25527.1 hypothetical protein C5695_17440 [Bacillus pumilus]TYS43598.1 hypothetical protein FZC68_05855 [Bacillus pumilus]
MADNKFVEFQKKNNLDSDDELFLITLSGAFCDFENDKASEIGKTTFINHFGEELNLSDIEGNTKEEYEKIIDQFLSKKDKKINVDELLQSFYAADMMDGLKKKFN